MYYNPVKVLREEHKLLQNAIDTTRQILELRDNELYFTTIKSLSEFFKTYTEDYHHPKEDDFLYPLLRNRAEKVNKKFLQELSEHHHDFNHLLDEVGKAIVMGDHDETHAAMEQYINRLSEHMRTENKVILSMADFLISEKESEMLCSEFMKLDGGEYGAKEQVKNTYHDILKQMV